MRRAFFLLAALLLVCLPARAEGDVRAVVDALDLQGFEETVGETGIDAREMLISIASGEETWELSDVLARLRDAFFEEFRRAAALVAALLAPALFSASSVSRVRALMALRPAGSSVPSMSQITAPTCTRHSPSGMVLPAARRAFLLPIVPKNGRPAKAARRVRFLILFSRRQ